MGDLRDKVDVVAAARDHKRAAHAGGPRTMARSLGRARGADRYPRRGRRHKR